MTNNYFRKQKRLYIFILLFLTGAVCLLEHTSSITCSSELEDEPLNKIYRRGKTTLELRIFPDDSGLAAKKFNHPYFFNKAAIVDILSSIYYIDKDVMKVMVKKGGASKRVFQNDEIEKLTPLIIEAFSKATPEQNLLVSSHSERFLLEGLNNVFSLFMTNDKLNIVFGNIRNRGSISKSSVIQTRNLEQYPEPTKVKKSHFWELAANPGQQFKPDHNNWLIIDFKSELFVHAIEERKKKEIQKYDNKLRPIVDPLEERIRKLEESLAKDNKAMPPDEASSPASRNYSTSKTADDNHKIESKKNDLQPENKKDIAIIREKFYALQELLKEDLITYADYEEKKIELLLAFQEYDVKESLKELKELNEMGFITNDDYENTKSGLLKKL